MIKDYLNDTFYLNIEETVREWVYRLRNVGINTECSCHHEGYIQCQSSDSTTELKRIYNVMVENNVEDYTIEIFTDYKKHGWYNHSLIIKSPVFKMGGK